jgi:MFS family permease
LSILLLVRGKLSLESAYWFIGFINVLINVPVVTLFQKLVPDHYRGRFYGMFGTLSQSLIPLAYFISGFVLGFWPPYSLMFFGGTALILVALGCTRLKELKKL